ncbi:rod shape-determining protein MreC [Halothermothrix orenii]|uniref:Cell shape-determining protein MreC n=1 Tax=Halothermothrix orenii (strain H 168 / OCM 544 / DSM 9562) TaxID=373903 RepID=B8CY03_HALOH|nr:rod shape-determining protein MreC [Halothermothrix orenii]ACL70172.1 rod shape-determining protein MreC [Halothermothrix orenii H 168]
MNKRTFSISISIILVLFVTSLGIINFTGVDIPYLNWLQVGTHNLISPIVNYITGICDSIQEYWNGIMNVKQLINENKGLEKKVANLERQLLVLKFMARENQRLRELLSFKEFVPYKTLGAGVIGYSPSPWKEKIIINRGSRDGIKPNMPVISYNGILVGRVDYVATNSSQVLLVSSPEFVVGGIVQRPESRAIGLVKGQLNEEGINLMDNLSWDADIKKGDLILTSGLSNRYPKGIPIGEVIKVEPDNFGLSQKARVELFLNLHTIEEVLVITDF